MRFAPFAQCSIAFALLNCCNVMSAHFMLLNHAEKHLSNQGSLHALEALK